MTPEDIGGAVEYAREIAIRVLREASGPQRVIGPPHSEATDYSVPLENASDAHIRLMVLGIIGDNTGVQFIYRGGTLSYHAMEWRIS